MIEAIRSNSVPNLLVLHYTKDWNVRDLLLVPSFFFNESAIEKRRPLGPNARRAGWVGCNILLSAIAPEGKLRIVSSGLAVPSHTVRERYASMSPLAKLNTTVRGWALDVLRMLRTLGSETFTLKEVYHHSNELARLHPANRNVQPKIRQQLQVLRDLGILEFLGHGHYRFVTSSPLG